MTLYTGVLKLIPTLCLWVSVGVSGQSDSTINDTLSSSPVTQDRPTKSVSNQAQQTFQPAQRIASGEFLLLSLYLNKHYLGEAFALKSDSGVQLGLSGLADILQFAVDVDVTTHSATGWYRDQQPFLLESNVLTTAEGAIHLTASDTYYDDDIYIDVAILKHAFAVDFEVDYADLEIHLRSDVPLPLELQQQRQARKFNNTNRKSRPTLPWKASPYQAISTPVADLQLNYSADKNQHRSSYSLLGAQDFAYLSSAYFLSGREGDLLSDSRLTFTKQDEQGRLLGGLGVTELEFGDVIATQVGSRYNSQYGRGFKFTNRALNKQYDNNRINLSGPIQLGWDVELYRNGVLISQQLSLADGRYIFDNIDLFYGDNNFELIFYGPQGQVERKTEYYFIDSNQLTSGESQYAFSLSEQGNKLLRNTHTNNNGWQVAGRYELGVTDDFSIYTAALGQKTQNDDVYHVSFGTNLSLFNRLLLNLDYEQNNQNQRELELTARSKLAEQSLLFSATHRTDQPGDEYSSYQFDMSGAVMQNDYGRINYQNNLLYQHSDSQGNYVQAQNRLNYAHSGFSLSNQLQWVEANNNERVDGSARLQGRLGRIYSRLGVNYTLSPVSEVTSYEAEFNRRITPHLQGELTLRDSRINDNQSADLGLSWQSDEFSVTGNLNYDSDDNWQLGVYSRFSLAIDAQTNNYFLSKQSLTTTGTLMLKVFIDENNNGILDEGEQGVKGVKVKGVQNYRQAVTDEQGVALLTSMPANRTTDIVLDQDSFTDPFLIPAHSGFSITPRAGFVEYMNYPLNYAGEIEGVVYSQQGQSNEATAYARVTLLDSQGHKVAQTQAAFDGYYVFTDLRPGEYRAVIDEDYKTKKALKETQNITVALSPQGDVVMGVDFVLAQRVTEAGFIVNAGSFSSLPFLKTYFELMKHHLKPDQQNRAFYLKVNEQYVLALGYAKTKNTELETLCAQLKSKNLHCTLQAQQITQ